MPAQSSPPAAPVVPGYVLEELLGRGGSGQVWRARPRGGGPPVAVKVLVRGDAARQEREAALLGELDHPHLVRLHEVVRREVRGGPAEVTLVLDLLAGGSLAALLARRGRLRPGEVVTAVAPVAAALAHAHDRGIVHGDLSPGNVVFTAEGRPVVTDLGTARLVGDRVGAEVTPAYVDPVVARGGAPGPASDVFGVAAAAFHALTGIAPWNAADPRGTLAVAADGELPDLELLAPESPEELLRVVRRGLSPEPHRRGSAAAFALDLRHACTPEPIRLPVTGVPDTELGATGPGRRTELTHQVPGRVRAAHAAPVPAGRLARLRAGLAERLGPAAEHGVRGIAGRLLHRAVVVAGVLAAVAVGLTGAAWAGASWGGGPAEPVPAAETTEQRAEVDATTTAPPADPSPTASPQPTGSAVPRADPAPVGVPAADQPVLPADDAAWTAVLTELYARRAAAFTAGDATLLAGVYVPGSALLDRDTTALLALRDQGRALRGFAPQVRRLEEVRAGADDRVELRLVDELPGYRVEPVGVDGPAATDVPARGATEVHLVVRPTDVGWRISEAQVEP
ncbi:serine/threonine-protein kinase [Modestobacter altitudinis]|uniref:serine/threonine-protein kinase n=1 Tax=Modestobacter altitudinis TaxID=2213158 RepID=UPI00110D00F4|nr:serine/threonine-protein kinase [Modestobacter altitudinis]